MLQIIKFIIFFLILNPLNLFLIKKQFTIDFIQKIYAKRPHYSIDIDQKIKVLNNTLDAHSQCLIQIQQQLYENQQDLDILTGHFQELQHRISIIVKDQKELHKKLYEELNKSNHIKNQISDSNNLKNHIIENNQIKKKLIKNDVNSDYQSSVALVLEKKQYSQAIQSFQNFIKNYPKSDYQPNAHYWLGQLYYNQGNKHDASYHFALVIKNYPKSSKAPDALLKIGILMQESNQQDKAKTIYKQLEKIYPHSEAAKQAQKRLSYVERLK